MLNHYHRHIYCWWTNL